MPARGAPKAEDFGCPARPQGCFAVWSESNRATVEAKLKADAIAAGKEFVENAEELKKAMSAGYKEIAPEEKKALQTDFKERMKKWEEDKKIWEMSPDYTVFQQKNASLTRKKALKEAQKKACEAGMPKKPKTAYFIFMESRYADVIKKKKAEMGSAFKVKEVSVEMAKMWTAMPEADKAAYIKTAQDLKAAYLKELEEYKKTDHYKTFAAEMTQARDEAKEHVKKARADRATAKAENRERVKAEKEAAKVEAKQAREQAREELRAQKLAEKEARRAEREAKRAPLMDGEAKPAAKRPRKTKTVTATGVTATAPEDVPMADVQPVPVVQPTPVVAAVPAMVAAVPAMVPAVPAFVA